MLVSFCHLRENIKIWPSPNDAIYAKYIPTIPHILNERFLYVFLRPNLVIYSRKILNILCNLNFCLIENLALIDFMGEKKLNLSNNFFWNRSDRNHKPGFVVLKTKKIKRLFEDLWKKSLGKLRLPAPHLF